MSDTHEPAQKSAQSPDRPSNRAIEEGVKSNLSRLRLPRRDQLNEVSARIERLAARVAKLEKETSR